MKKTNYFLLSLAFFLMFVCLSNSFSQTPQYYNYNTTSGSNYFPFGVVAGKQVQWLILPGELNQPTPITNGFLTKLYIMMSYTNGNVTLTDLTIKCGLCSLTTLPSGVIYTGPLDTVYFRPTITLTSTIGQWMILQFDKPFGYDSTKSLVLDISQCGATNTSMLVSQTTLSGFRRTAANMSGMCNFVESYQGGEVLNCGFDIVTAPNTPNYYNTNAGSSNNVYPWAVTSGKECQWLIRSGDFINPSAAPSGYITSLYFFMGGAATNTFTGLTIKLGRTALTNLPASIYAGPMDTVYYRPSVTLTSATAAWMQINLDKAYFYDNTQSLVIDVINCQCTSSSMYQRQSTGTGTIRNYITGSSGCAMTYTGQDAQIVNAGVNLFTLTGIHPIVNNNVPSVYSLEQNYPNPFNPATNINFSIPKEGLVNLVVYDILGREVATLTNKVYKPGNYNVTFDASNLSSGVYFYRLKVNDFNQTKKMSLIK